MKTTNYNCSNGVRGVGKFDDLPSSKVIRDLYSLARNTLETLDATLQEHAAEFYELIMTRHAPTGNGGYALWAHSDKSPQNEPSETYFLNSLPSSLMDEHVHYQPPPPLPCREGKAEGVLHVPTGPVPGAGGVGECVANIEPLDVSNRDEVGVGEILTSTSPAERV